MKLTLRNYHIFLSSEFHEVSVTFKGWCLGKRRKISTTSTGFCICFSLKSTNWGLECISFWATIRVRGSNLVTHLNLIPIFEWWVARCRSKIGHKNEAHSKDIGLHAQNLFVILGSLVNVSGERGGGEPMWRFMDHVSGFWHNKLTLSPKLHGIDPDFFRHIWGCTTTSTPWIQVVWGSKERKGTEWGTTNMLFTQT